MLNRRCAKDAANADAAIGCEEDILQRWLSGNSSSVVLSPDAIVPRMDVISEILSFDDQEVFICITAWDQCGMAPLQLLRNGSALRQELPETILNAVRRIHVPNEISAGLDLIDGQDEEAEVFPRMRAGHWEEYVTPATDNGVRESAQPLERDSSAHDDSVPAIGELVATHNSGQDGAMINVNTAPLALLKHALLLSGRGGIELIHEHRRAGRLVPLNDLVSRVPMNGAAANRIQLTGRSTLWSFRVDVRVGLVHRSWWAIYQRNRSQWQCVQRLLIHE